MSGRKKIMLLGDIGVGKTSLIRRLVLDRIDGTYKGTLGFDLYTFTVGGVGTDGDRSLPLVIWDTDGNIGVNIFRHDVYMQGTAAALIVGDATRPETQANMVALATGFRNHHPGRHAAFVLNKADLVTGAPASSPALLDLVQSGIPLTVTSALTGDNVVAAFAAAATSILRRES